LLIVCSHGATSEHAKWKPTQRNRSTATIKLEPIKSANETKTNSRRKHSPRPVKNYETDEGFASNDSSGSASSANVNVIVVDVGATIKSKTNRLSHRSKTSVSAKSHPGLVITAVKPSAGPDYGRTSDFTAPTLATDPIKMRSKNLLFQQAKKLVASVLSATAQELSEEEDAGEGKQFYFGF
jgi:hypothetical protein